MAFDDPEVQLAELFELLINVKFGVVPGPRARKDAAEGAELQVDFVYEHASTRPLALEATSMPFGELEPAISTETHWSNDIDEIVRSEQLGSWIVHFRSTSPNQGLKNTVVELLRSRLSDAYFDSQGRFSILRNEAGSHDGIEFFGSSHPDQPSGFSRELLVTAVANTSKLAEARPRTTHLMVLAGKSRSRDPNLTKVPPSGETVPPLAAIDRVWVTFHPERQGLDGSSPWIWWARPGDPAWETHSGPL